MSARKKVEEIHCSQCGLLFEQARISQRYCSRECYYGHLRDDKKQIIVTLEHTDRPLQWGVNILSAILIIVVYEIIVQIIGWFFF